MSARKGKIFIQTDNSNIVDVSLSIPQQKIYEIGSWVPAEPNIMDVDDPPNTIDRLPEVVGLKNWRITPTNPVDDEERTYRPRPALTTGWSNVPHITLQNVTYTFNTTTTTNTPVIVTGP